MAYIKAILRRHAKTKTLEGFDAIHFLNPYAQITPAWLSFIHKTKMTAGVGGIVPLRHDATV